MEWINVESKQRVDEQIALLKSRFPQLEEFGEKGWKCMRESLLDESHRLCIKCPAWFHRSMPHNCEKGDAD